MGIYYIPKNKEVKDLLENYSGADLLGRISLLAGVELAPSPFGSLRPKYKRNKKQCIADAEKISRIDEFMLILLYNSVSVTQHGMLFEGSLDDFKIYVNSWVDFLLNCNGYEAI